MYQVLVKVILEDGTTYKRLFNYWGNAATWIEDLANEGDSLPAEVTMEIIR